MYRVNKEKRGFRGDGRVSGKFIESADKILLTLEQPARVG